MSFFPRSFVAHEANNSFHPLFRLLDDFDQYSRSNGNGNGSGNKHHQRSTMKSFTPKFDVKEIGDVYELHGELPGVEQKDIEIEFTDAQTLTIRGRTERSYTAGTPPAGTIDGPAAQAAITASSRKEHQPAVEDEDTSQATPNTTATSSNESAKQEEKPKEPDAKYWVSERSVGEFARSFTFPVRVDQDQVHASMKNGILRVLVPKSKKIEARKITIA